MRIKYDKNISDRYIIWKSENNIKKGQSTHKLQFKKKKKSMKGSGYNVSTYFS